MNGMRIVLCGLLMAFLAIGYQSAAEKDPAGDSEGGRPLEGRSILPAPKGLRAGPKPGAMLLEWKPVRGAEGCRIYWSKKGHRIRASALMDDVPAGRCRYRVDSLLSGCIYTFRVCALRSCEEGKLSGPVSGSPVGKIPASTIAFSAYKKAAEGDGMSDPSISQSVKMRLLPSPKGFRATPKVKSVVLQWKPVRGSEGYRIYWEAEEERVSPCSTRLDDVPQDQLRYEVRDLFTGVMYRFRICTLRSSIEGPLSRQVGAMPEAEARSGPRDEAP